MKLDSSQGAFLTTGELVNEISLPTSTIRYRKRSKGRLLIEISED